MQEEKRRGFVFNYSWINMLKDESDEVKLEAFDAIMAYATSGQKIQPSKDFRMAYKLIVKDIDYNELSYQEAHEKKSNAAHVRWTEEKQKRAYLEQCNAMQTMQCNANYADRMIDRNDRNDRNDRIEEKEKEKEDVGTSSLTRTKKKKDYINPLDVEVIADDDEQFKEFRQWQREFTPNTLKMKYTNFITEMEFWNLVLKINPTKEPTDHEVNDAINKIKNTLLQVENRPDKRKNYSNLYITTLNWLKREGAIKDSNASVESYRK